MRSGHSRKRSIRAGGSTAAAGTAKDSGCRWAACFSRGLRRSSKTGTRSIARCSSIFSLWASFWPRFCCFGGNFATPSSSFFSPFPPYLASVGAPTINAGNLYPALERWRNLDPAETAKESWNRYAAGIRFDVRSGASVSIRMTGFDTFRVECPPDTLPRLGVRHVLSRRDLEPLSGDAVRFLPEVRASGWTVYSVETAEGVSPESHGVEELATETDKADFFRRSPSCPDGSRHQRSLEKVWQAWRDGVWRRDTTGKRRVGRAACPDRAFPDCSCNLRARRDAGRRGRHRRTFSSGSAASRRRKSGRT